MALSLDPARLRRAALAGAGASLAWAAAEPVAARIAGTGYTDTRLLGRAVTASRAWPLAGVAVHAVNGAVFGLALEALGQRGAARGVLAAQAENVALWPLMAAVDRFHPDARGGRWPRPLVRSRRTFAQEVAMHALFGALLGRTLARRP